MSELPVGFVKIPLMFLVAEEPAVVDIRIYMPLNRKLIIFRRCGDHLSVDDVMHLQSQTSAQILIAQEDYEGAMARFSTMLRASFDPDGDLGEPSKAMATSILKTMNVRDPKAAPEVKRAPLDNAADLARYILISAQGAPKSAYYDSILTELKGDDRFSTHNRHVGALAAIMMMSLGGYNKDNVTDITFAGFFHDLYLKELPPLAVSKHLAGDDLGTQVLKMPELGYYRHIDLVLKKFEAEKVPATADAIRMIVEHHENFDGSGLKGMRGEAIFRPSSILRIADDMICLVNSTIRQHSLSSAFATLENMNEKHERPIYDPELIEKLCPIFD